MELLYAKNLNALITGKPRLTGAARITALILHYRRLDLPCAPGRTVNIFKFPAALPDVNVSSFKVLHFHRDITESSCSKFGLVIPRTRHVNRALILATYPFLHLALAAMFTLHVNCVNSAAPTIALQRAAFSAKKTNRFVWRGLFNG